MLVELDSLDWKLVHLLAHDASDLPRVARELELGPEEVRRRLDRLRERGVIKDVVARVSPDKVGLPVTAFYLVRVAQTQSTYEGVAEILRDVDQVEEAHAISGQYDWLVKVRAESVADLQNVLTNRLALIPGFARAESMVALSAACDRANVDAALHPRES